METNNNIHTTSLMKNKVKGRKYVNKSRRKFSYEYSLRIGNVNKQLWKQMSLSTLGGKKNGCHLTGVLEMRMICIVLKIYIYKSKSP